MDATAGAVVVGRTLDSANATAKADEFSSAAAVAAFALYFARGTGTEDVVLSLPVTARTNRVLRGSGGMISNVVPLRLAVTATTTVAELSAAASLELTGALRHQRYRTEDMRRDRGLGAERGFFGPAINIMNFHPEVVLGSVTGRFHVLSTGPVEDLSVNIYPSASGEAPRIDFEANPHLYTADVLSDHVRRYVELLSRYMQALPDTRVHDLEILSEAERKSIVPARGPDALAPMTLPTILAHGVAASSEGIALSCGTQQLSYRELDRRSNVLARMLIRRGVGPGTSVVIALPRSIDAVIAWWSVAKTGAASVPVDPTYPVERIDHMVGDSNAVVGITDSTVHQMLPVDLDCISIDAFSFVGDESVVDDSDRTAPLRSGSHRLSDLHVRFHWYTERCCRHAQCVGRFHRMGSPRTRRRCTFASSAILVRKFRRLRLRNGSGRSVPGRRWSSLRQMSTAAASSQNCCAASASPTSSVRPQF